MSPWRAAPRRSAHSSIPQPARARRASGAPSRPRGPSSPGTDTRALRWRSRDQPVIDSQRTLLDDDILPVLPTTLLQRASVLQHRDRAVPGEASLVAARELPAVQGNGGDLLLA